MTMKKIYNTPLTETLTVTTGTMMTTSQNTLDIDGESLHYDLSTVGEEDIDDAV